MANRRGGATGAGIWLLGRFARSRLGQNESVRRSAQNVLFRTARSGFRLANAAVRSFKSARTLLAPLRPATARAPDLFDLTPTGEQALIRDTLRTFAAERLRPAAGAADTACTPPAELLAEGAALGLSGMAVPADLGGSGSERSAVTQALIAEALAHGDMGLAVACLAPQGVASALAEWGTTEQQARYLPAFAADQPPAAAIALLEPQPLSDPFAPETRAEKRRDGYVLEGAKALVPVAAACELFLVAARTEDGPAMFVVEADAGGLRLESEPAMGLRGAGLGRLLLKRVAVPAAARLELDAAAYEALVHRCRLAWCALAVGTAQAVLDHVIPYVNERSAFGEPISHRQSVAFAVANIAIELEGMRLLTWRAAARADHALPFAREAALARRACADHGMRIGSDGVQLLGGHGFVKEHPVERWYRDLRAVGIMEGGVML